MAVSSPTFKPIVSIGALDISIIETVTVLGEATITLPTLAKSLVIRSRLPSELRVSTSLGGQYITIRPYCTLNLDGLEISGKILYISSTVPVTTIEALITHG